MRVRLTKRFRFEAAHWLPTFPEGHRCRRLHGHSFQVDVIVAGEVPQEQGYLIDYGVIRAATRPIEEALDHRLLNEIPGLENPTAEVIAKWIFDRLLPSLPLLEEICVEETCTSACSYRAD
ncbi:MAG: 6-carboxytetrahydropterin synthase QueD [Planctomycetota bacterium]|nr:6-carboxytetrahydropterin synthase QueD [Planctomycetota bacterium]